MNPIRKAWWIAKGVGWDNVPRRLYQSAAIRSGILRRKLEPANYAWSRFLGAQNDSEQSAKWEDRSRRFLSIPTREELRSLVPTEEWNASVLRVCQRAIEGKYLMFSRWDGELGWPPNFNRDPMNGIDWPTGIHWLDSAKSGPPRNDIKLVWEASRFSLGFYFARAYVYTGDECWAESFWQMVDSWIDQNPVNASVAWGCGQEIAFRLMAMLTGAFATRTSESATPYRLGRLEFLCWQSAKRIEANINYAISQENNHALSEALGIWTVGLLFSEFPESIKWVDYAESVLAKEIHRQVYEDGSYVQHSMSYHRVMLDDMCWWAALGIRNNRQLNDQMVARVGKSVEWLAEFVDPDNGRVPNYGANDGANVLPLSCSDYLDYRPTLQASAKLFRTSDGSLPIGAWSEKTLWLCGRESCDTESVTAKQSVRTAAWQAPTGGYYILRGANSYLMVRATRFKDRPSQCDMLHVDLWMGGHNILRDAGSFRYYHETGEVKKYFYSAQAHNTVQVLDQEQMQKGPNFLWFCWPKGNARLEDSNRLNCHARFACKIPYSHHRIIERNENNYRIEDSIEGADSFKLRWHLAPELVWKTVAPNVFRTFADPFGTITIRLEGQGSRDATLIQSWESLYYAERSEMPVILVSEARGSFVTTIEWEE